MTREQVTDARVNGGRGLTQLTHGAWRDINIYSVCVRKSNNTKLTQHTSIRSCGRLRNVCWCVRMNAHALKLNSFYFSIEYIIRIFTEILRAKIINNNSTSNRFIFGISIRRTLWIIGYI